MPWPRASAVVRTMAGNSKHALGHPGWARGPGRACHLALTWFPGLGLPHADPQCGALGPACDCGPLPTWEKAHPCVHVCGVCVAGRPVLLAGLGPGLGAGGVGPGGRDTRPDCGLAAQWSVEDEEEAARERRRRDRERQLRAQDEDEGSPSPEQSEQEKLLSPKPSEAPELDEDEGFGDWSQKPEQQRQQHWGAGETTDAGDPPGGESPEGTQEDDRPHQSTSGTQGADELSPAEVRLEELHLSPDLEPREGLAAEAPEPSGPEEPVQGSPGLAGTEEAEHQSCRQPRTPSPLVLEGTEVGSPPLSPSTKLSDRTESLNRSIKKSNSVKRSQPALPISKIDERLEQYTQAVETAGRTPKLTRQPSIELPSMAVASTKSRWETGEVQAQSAAKSAPCKDIVAGDMSRRDLWEQKGGPKTSSTVKSTPSGKRYKFVATGHGKYEKVLVDEGPAP
ncbi:lymphocyte-specific protein 1 isoform X2 [Cervus canadensis]|uniref:lymphocyte-specific protein 1 isoform X2 n=1 Tax=Cervus canadensis TaxID=1574408 RepID=UPI001CA31F17|nr:lymphocyte-specific protein 1 isoform X2 [Cervus canadensis]